MTFLLKWCPGFRLVQVASRPRRPIGAPPEAAPALDSEWINDIQWLGRPTRRFFPIDQPFSAFVRVPSQDAGSPTLSDLSSLVHVYLTILRDARAAQPTLHFGPESCLCWAHIADGASTTELLWANCPCVQGGSAGGSTSLKGRPLWCDASDSSSDASTSPLARGDAAPPLPSCPNSSLTVPSTLTSTNDDDVAPVPISLATAIRNGTAESDASDLETFAVPEGCRAAVKEWTANFLAFLSSQSRAASFFKALQSILSIEPSVFANTCAQLATSLPSWNAFFCDSASRFADVPFEFIHGIHACLNCPPVLLWVLPSQHCLLLSDGTCAPFEYGILAFPCIAYNALNGFYFPLRVVRQPVFVPALSETAAPEHLQLLLFGLVPLHLPATENIFYCFKSTRLECLHFLKTLQATVRMPPCRCLQRVGEHLCGCGLSQLCLVLSPAYVVDLIIIDSYSCLFHVSSFHSFRPLSWQAAIQKLRSPNCFLFVFVHSTGHFVQAMLHVPSSSSCPEVWLGQPQPTAREACVARVPLNVADPPLTARLSRHAMQRFATCAGGASSEPAAGASSSAPRGSADTPVGRSLRDECSSLLHCSPEVFDRTFQRIYQRSPERAQVVARYLLADLVRFPVDLIEAELPEIFSMTSLLAQKAGCPFEWAFLLFLPLLGTACAKARLYINEFFSGATPSLDRPLFG